MKPATHYLAQLFDKGTLPQRVRLAKSDRHFSAGTVFCWSVAHRCYVPTEPSRFVLNVSTVKRWLQEGVLSPVAVQKELFSHV